MWRRSRAESIVVDTEHDVEELRRVRKVANTEHDVRITAQC